MGFRIDAKTEAKLRADGVITIGNQFVAPIEDRVSEKCGYANEEAFQREVLAFARRNGWKCYHARDSRRSEPGFPDIVAMRAGVQLAIELKMPGNKATAEQLTWLELFAECGAKTGVYYPKDWPKIVELLA